MDYFRVMQDERFLNTPRITNIQDIVIKRRDVTIDNADKIQDINIGFDRSKDEPDFPDILDRQLFMINEKVKEVFELYDPALQFKTICILNNPTGTSCLYYIPLFREVDCLVEEQKNSVKQRQAKQLAVIESQIHPFSIVKAKADADIILIRLDVAESLLRRKITRWTAERVSLVETEKGSYE